MTSVFNIQHVSPLVKHGQPAHFLMLPGDIWHRTENYPTPCTCSIAPKMGSIVKPAMDDSWRYVPDEHWAPCLTMIAKFDSDTRDHYDLTQFGKQAWVMQIGERIELHNEAKGLYDTGRDGEWYVEEIGRARGGETAPIVRIRDKQTGTFAWAPLAWVRQWKPVPKEEPVVDMTDPEQGKRYFLSFPISPTDDKEITCVICNKNGVTHEFTHRQGGRRSWQGIHLDCARTILHVELSPPLNHP